MAERIFAVDENFDFPAPVAARVAEKVATQVSSATAPKLDKKDAAATYASNRVMRPNGPTTVFLGDSNTYLPGPGRVGLWSYQASVKSKQRIRFGGVYAQPGDTTQEAAARWLPAILALDPAPAACIIALGTNDTNRNNGADFNLEANAASYLAIVQALKARGIAPIATLIIPNNNGNAVIQTNIQKWNYRLRTMGDAHGFPVVDTYTPLVNTANGQLQAAYLHAADGLGLHLNDLGRKKFGDTIAEHAAALYPPAPLVTSKFGTDPTNLVPWTTSFAAYNDTANGTTTTVAPVAADNLSGMWREVTYSGTATYLAQSGTVVPSAPIAGHRLSFTGRVQTTGVEASVAAGNQTTILVRVEIRDAASASLGYMVGIYDWTVDADGTWSVEFDAPANANKFVVQYSINKASPATPVKLRVGEVTIRDLTLLG